MQEEIKEVVRKKRTVRTPVAVQTDSVGLTGKQLSVSPFTTRLHRDGLAFFCSCIPAIITLLPLCEQH